MAKLILIILVLLSSIEGAKCQNFFRALKKEQFRYLKNEDVSNLYRIEKWYKKIIKTRNQNLEEVFNQEFSNSDSLFICEYIGIPNSDRVKGVIYDNKTTFYAYNFLDDLSNFSLRKMQKDSLFTLFKYSIYLHDKEFTQLKNDFQFSSPICDGVLVVLIKCTRVGKSYTFQSIIFKSFQKHQMINR